MLLPANNWNSLEITEPWYTIRNVFLIAMQTIIAPLIIRDAVRAGDKAFSWIGGMIFVSLVCYAPVVAFVQQYPMVGMLMIPKTMAYLVIAVIGLYSLFPNKKDAVVGA